MILSGYKVELREVQQQDLELLRLWRNDPKISQFMLSREFISTEQQQAWFNKIQSDPKQQHFIIAYKGQEIGSANIQLYSGESLQNAAIIEPGLYIYDDKYRGNVLAFAPTLLLNDYCFEQLGVKYLKAVVKSDNLAALNYNQKLGYRILKHGELIEISLNYDDYQQASTPLKRLFSR